MYYSILAAGIKYEQGALVWLFLLSSLFFTIFCHIDSLLFPGPLRLRSCRTTLGVIPMWMHFAFCWFCMYPPEAGDEMFLVMKQRHMCMYWRRRARQCSTDFITPSESFLNSEEFWVLTLGDFHHKAAVNTLLWICCGGRIKLHK